MKNKKCKEKRRCSHLNVLAAEVQLETKLQLEAEKKVVLHRNMSRWYWERWHWELQQRNDLMLQERGKLCGHKTDFGSDKVKVLEIDPAMLKDPVNADGQSTDTYIGQGSFAVVKLQTYRGFNVAITKFLPSMVEADIQREAKFLAQFCHPYLPMLFGVVTSTAPYRIVIRLVCRKLEWGVLIQSIVDPRCGGLGVQPPAAVAYLTKDNPENPLLTHTAIKSN